MQALKIDSSYSLIKINCQNLAAWVKLVPGASIISVDLELCCVAVLAAAVMASELLPALHFFMWVWGAGAIGDDRFQPEVGEDEEQPEPVEIWWPFRLFWLLAAAGRVYLAVRLFNCAAGHVIYSGFDETSGVSDPNEKLLNAAAMVFVVEIDDIFGELTLPPGLRGLLERVPAVSGTIYGQDPSVPEKNQSVAEFLGVEAWLCSTRFMGFGIVTMFTTVLWQSAIWDTGEGEEDFVWDRLRMIHGAPIFLYFVMWAIHCMILRQSNRVEMQKSLEEGQPGQREATQATHVTQEPLDAKAEADAEAASPGSPGPSLPGTVAGGDDS